MATTKPRRARNDHTRAEILGRLIKPAQPDFSPEAARAILRLKFDKSDLVRVDRLSSRAQKGSMTAEERAEMEEYILLADVLAMLKSKARLSLKTAGLCTQFADT
jgi:hypothetical protein